MRTLPVLLCLATVCSSLNTSQDVGEACSLKDDDGFGVCTRIDNCKEALEALNQRVPHGLFRCGFDGFTEVVCCPGENRFETFRNRVPAPALRRLQDEIADLKHEVSRLQQLIARQKKIIDDQKKRILFLEGYPKKKQVGQIAKRECDAYSEKLTPPIDLHIVGGEEASVGEFPHMAALGYYVTGGINFKCGGSLISASYILTAAHCVINVDSSEPSFARMGVVAIGEKQYDPNTDYNISRIIVHPDYDLPAKYNDIALLRLSSQVHFTGNLRPICLYTSLDDPKTPLSVTGWGVVDSKKNLRSNVLLKANLTVVPVSDCSRYHTTPRSKNILPRGIIQQQICAGDREGTKDACEGDSGGPLQDMTSPDAQYRIVGITSFGRGCGNTNPGVYTRVASYVEWIENTVWPS